MTITKQGKGSAAICLPAKNKIVVEEGDLRLRNRMPNVNSETLPSQTPTVAAGSKLIAAGDGGFANLTIPAGTPLVVRSQGVEMEMSRNWACNGWATVRPDGILSLTDSHVNSVGSTFAKNKVDVSKSFTLTFDCVVFGPDNSWYCDGGMAVVLCADTAWIVGGGSYEGLGYYNGEFTNTTHKSVAFGFHAYSKKLSYGVNGVKSGSDVALRMNALQINNGYEAPHRMTVSYDAAAGTFTLTAKFRSGIVRTITREGVNLATVLGATTAYLGFTGSTVMGGPIDYLVSNVSFTDLAAPVAMSAGGNVTATAVTPLKVEVLADAGDPAIMMKNLTYKDGAVLDIASLAVGGKGEITDKPVLAKSANWALTGGAHWLDETSIGLSYTNYNAKGELTRENGCAYSPAPFNIDRDWTLDFDFRFGQRGGGVKADAFNIAFLTDTRQWGWAGGNGFTVYCRYYLNEAGKYTLTRLQFYDNGNEAYKSDWVDDCAPVRLYDTEAAHVSIVHAKAAKTLTITLTDAKGTFTKTLSNFDMKTQLGGAETAYLRLFGQVGGSWTENIVSNLKFTGGADRVVAQSALGFDRWNGSGTVVKRGSGSLAIVSNNAQNVSVKIEQGGLYLAKEGVNDYRDTGRGGWIRSDKWLEGEAVYGGVLVGAPSPTSSDANRACDTHFRHRLPMGRSWTLSADCYAVGHQNWGGGGEQYWPGNALTIFAHNDPHGVSYLGSAMSHGGFNNSVKNGWALNFFTYSDAGSCRRFCWTTGGPRYTMANVSASFAPITIGSGTTTHFDIVHDASAKTVKVTLKQGSNTATATFSDVDIKTCLGGDEMAWFGFGCGGGGAHGIFDWHNIHLTFPDMTDRNPDVNFLKDVEIATAQAPVFVDSRRANGVFRLAPTVTVGAGNALLARSVSLPATLTMGTLNLGEGAIVGGDDQTLVKPDAIICAGDLRVEKTTLVLTDKNAVGERNDLYITAGGKVRLDFTGTLYVRRIYVDGIRQKGALYGAGGTAADWIDPASTGSLAPSGGTILIIR